MKCSDVAGNLLHPPGDLGHREVLVAVVHGLELAADNRDNGSSEQTQLPGIGL
jgi:hypothetical protein